MNAQFKTKKTTLPTGLTVVIREHNGADEELLTNFKTSETGDNILNYLASVIIEPVLTPSQISEWNLKDKYYALLEAIILTQGDTLKFQYTFSNDPLKEKFNFVQDLREYTWDLSNITTLPKPGYENPTEPHLSYHPNRITPYILGAAMGRELKLESGKVIRYRMLNTHGEKLMGKKTKDTMNSNDIFRARFMEWQNPHAENAWLPVEDFSVMSAKDLREIRKDMTTVDRSWDMLVDLVNPKTGEQEQIPLIYLPDFFRPTEI